MSNQVNLLPCPFCGSLDVDAEGVLRGDGRRSPECEVCGATTDTAALWNTRAAPAEDVRFVALKEASETLAGIASRCIERADRLGLTEDGRAVVEEPVNLQHMAVAENGVLRWMSGRKMQDCELYALPGGGAIRDELYRHPQRPVVLPQRDQVVIRSTVTVPQNMIIDERQILLGWQACIAETERLNK